MQLNNEMVCWGTQEIFSLRQKHIVYTMSDILKGKRTEEEESLLLGFNLKEEAVCASLRTRFKGGQMGHLSR